MMRARLCMRNRRPTKKKSLFQRHVPCSLPPVCLEPVGLLAFSPNPKPHATAFGTRLIRGRVSTASISAKQEEGDMCLGIWIRGRPRHTIRWKPGASSVVDGSKVLIVMIEDCYSAGLLVKIITIIQRTFPPAALNLRLSYSSAKKAFGEAALSIYRWIDLDHCRIRISGPDVAALWTRRGAPLGCCKSPIQMPQASWGHYFHRC